MNTPQIEEPDCFDINDWLVMRHPNVFDAIKYLQPTTQYRIGLIYWKEQGCPDISEVWE